MNSVHGAEAINEAIALLYYAARNGIDIDPEIKKTIDRSRGKNLEDLTEEDRLSFWNAFTFVADKLKPVTPDSIKYTRNVGIKGLSRRSVQVPLHVIISSLALLFLVSVQVFWVGGWSLVTDVKANLEKVEAIQAAIIDEESRLSPTEFTTPEIDRKYIQLRSALAQLTSTVETLHAWNLLWSKFPFMHPPFKSSTYLQYDIETRANIDVDGAKLFLHASLVYGLPLLYGLVGSCFYVLRTLAREVRTWTFTQQSSINYLLRIALGPLAGLAAGLLLLGSVDQNVFAIGSISIRALGPLMIAFAAGYGVELIFAVLDRIVQSFTRTGT